MGEFWSFERSDVQFWRYVERVGFKRLLLIVARM